MAGAQRSIVINAPRETVFDVIADFDRYAEFLPEVKRISTSNRQGNQVDVAYEVDVIKTIKYVLRVTLERPGRLSWAFVKGEMMKDNKGSWVLEEVSPSQTRATYTLEMALGPLVPKAIVNTLAESQLPKMLDAFKARAEAAAR